MKSQCWITLMVSIDSSDVQFERRIIHRDFKYKHPEYQIDE